MTSSSLTAPKLRLKPLFLIGTLVVLAGLLLAAVDHFIWGGVYYNSYYEGWIFYINTPFTECYWYPDEFFFRSILDGGWLYWITEAVVWDFPAVGTVLATAAVMLFAVYLLFGYRMKRGTTWLSLSLLSAAAYATWTSVCILVNWTYFYVFDLFAYNFGSYYFLKQLLASLKSMLFAILDNPMAWIGILFGAAMGFNLLIAAIALLLSPRVGKIVAVAEVVLTAVTYGLYGLISTVFYILDLFGGDIYFTTSKLLWYVPLCGMLLFLLLFAVLLISNRLQPVFGKK